jgi:hypothetical protein
MRNIVRIAGEDTIAVLERERQVGINDIVCSREGEQFARALVVAWCESADGDP